MQRVTLSRDIAILVLIVPVIALRGFWQPADQVAA